jgi:PAS domain S-box-containing protein
MKRPEDPKLKAAIDSQIERSLAEREMLQVIFDKSPIMVSCFDASGRLLFVNREWSRVLGWTLEEARSIDLFEAAYPDPSERQRAANMIRDGEHRWLDFRTRTRDGTMINTSWMRIILSDGTRFGLGTDITERVLAKERLHQSFGELQALAERLRGIREEERTRVAREMHDEVGQCLTALQMDAAWLRKKRPTEARNASGEKLAAMSALIDTALAAVQRIATELRPGVLDEFGLEAAVEWYVSEFEKRTGVQCRIASELGGQSVDPARSTEAFRIVQEALTNVARHSRATRAEIRLGGNTERFVLEIHDNGRGMAPERLTDSRSLGLIGMRESAHSLGGEIAFLSGPGGGTTVAVSFPLSRSRRRDDG